MVADDVYNVDDLAINKSDFQKLGTFQFSGMM